ncbi:MAG: hypothetical protein WEB04_09900 [Dehalococcoidia bacterium]
MKSVTMDRINQLSAERSRLYALATNGQRGESVRRVREVSQELEVLWDRRRGELAGHRDAIELLVDRAYERVYGAGFDDVVMPPRVDEPEEEVSVAA